MICYFLLETIQDNSQWRIQNFKNGRGGVRPGVLQFLRSEDCFDAPSLIPYAFVVRVENKIYIVTLHVDYNKVYAQKCSRSLLFHGLLTALHEWVYTAA